jgi:hypothetical protein
MFHVHSVVRAMQVAGAVSAIILLRRFVINRRVTTRTANHAATNTAAANINAGGAALPTSFKGFVAGVCARRASIFVCK